MFNFEFKSTTGATQDFAHFNVDWNIEFRVAVWTFGLVIWINHCVSLLDTSLWPLTSIKYCDFYVTNCYLFVLFGTLIYCHFNVYSKRYEFEGAKASMFWSVIEFG